jgi:hypothetical protein
VDAGKDAKLNKRNEEEKDEWLKSGEGEIFFMDDAKLRDATANALSWLPSETKQLGLSNPPPLSALQPLYALANHPHPPISFVDWFPALLMW